MGRISSSGLKHLDRVKGRSGEIEFIYYRIKGKSGRHLLPGTDTKAPAFLAAYHATAHAVLTGAPIPALVAAAAAPSGSLKSWIERYQNSPAWLVTDDGEEMSAATLKDYRNALARFAKCTGSKGGVAGDMPIAAIEGDHVRAMFADFTAYQQRHAVKALRRLFAYARKAGALKVNPMDGIKFARVKKNDGEKDWPEHEIARFEAAHPIGTQARLWFAIALFTGLRRTDVCALGPQHVSDRSVDGRRVKWLTINLSKGKRHAAVVDCEIDPRLVEIIRATPVIGRKSFLVTSRGTPYSPNALNTKIRQWCDEARITDRELSGHGLRKRMITRMVEAGCSDIEIQARSGHIDRAQIAHYSKKFNREKAGGRALRKVLTASSPELETVSA